MKKVVRIIVILAVLALLIVDFMGLWKYKLSGKQYKLASSSEGDAAPEDTVEVQTIEYKELSSSDLKSDEVLFIKNIENKDSTYIVKGIIYTPFEVSKDDYTSLRNGKSVEILGTTYTKSQIKANNLVLKSSDSNGTGYYINYDTKNKKYILKESKTDYVVYKSTEQNVKFEVNKGTAFSTVKDKKTQNDKIENVIDTHKNVTEPDGETASINTCELTFDKSGKCTKIVETCR